MEVRTGSAEPDRAVDFALIPSISGLSILLNLRTGKVRTLLGDMTVIKDGSDEVVSSQPLVEEGRVTGKTITSINRITGQTSILRVAMQTRTPYSITN
jgi:hypothetical protein